MNKLYARSYLVKQGRHLLLLILTFVFLTRAQAQVISSFSPANAVANSVVTITGTGLEDVSGVSFGGTPAVSFTVLSATTISATVGYGTSGSVTVWSVDSTDLFRDTSVATLAGFVYIPPAGIPSITSFMPTTAYKDSLITITGFNFTSTTAVLFGGTPAASFSVVSPTEIQAVAGSGSSGNVTVITQGTGDTAQRSGFIYAKPTPLPVITSFSPVSAATDSTVIITGTGFSEVTEVDFGGTPSPSFAVLSSTTISAVVGYGSSGTVSVEALGGRYTATLDGFTCTTYPVPPLPPTITSFSPTSASRDAAVIINGTDFKAISAVTFGSTPALSFTVVSPTMISAIVGNGTSGYVSVRNDTGTASLGGFIYLPPPDVPAITSFSPTTAFYDTVVTINGFNFTGATAVLFGGTPAASFMVVSPEEIQAILGAGSSGTVTVITPGQGDTAFQYGFTYAAPPFSVLQFTGSLVNDQAQLQWQTQSEGAVSQYTIEHSTDSITFTSIDVQLSQNKMYGVNQYTFIDPNISAGKNFYRLEVQDTPYTWQAGPTEFTVEITLNKGTNSMVSFPNPARGQVPVNVPVSTQTGVLQLLDLKGNVMATTTLAPGTTQTQVNFTGVSPGIYMLSWNNGTRIQTKRVMVGN
jgi:hypothetical protein